MSSSFQRDQKSIQYPWHRTAQEKKANKLNNIIIMYMNNYTKFADDEEKIE